MATGKIQQVTNDSGTNSNGYYCKMPDGTLIQWGVVMFPNAQAGDQRVTTTFPFEYSDNNYRIVLSWQDNSEKIFDYFYSLSVPAKTSSTFTAGAKRKISGYDWYASWIAIGRWK